MPTVTDLLVSRLQDAGVRALFGVPGGGSNLDVIDAAGRRGLPFVLTATETGAALAAIAQAEVTGAPGACLTTLGPGVSSASNGVACAFLDRAPLVVLTDAQTAPDGFTHQRLDHGALIRPIAKMSALLIEENADELLELALKLAMAAPRGPVHLDCAWQAPDGRAPRKRTAGRLMTRMIRAKRSRFDDVVGVSRRPLVIAGLDARQAGASVREFCERRRIPAMVTYKAKGVVPDDSPAFAGVFTNAAIERPIVDQADLLIAIGLDPVELIPRPWTFPQPVVYCGDAMIPGHVPFEDSCSGVASALARLDERLSVAEWDLESLRSLVDRARASVRTSASGGLPPDRVIEIAAARLAATCRVTVDAGAHMFLATMLWPVAEPNGMLISNGLSTMGFALPAAIGAALIDRGEGARAPRPVVALTGDGGLLMCVGELMTAARERLKLVVIVFSDASLSLIEIKQQARQYCFDGVALGRVGWTTLAESFGLAAFSAGREDELTRAIDAAMAVDGPALIEARIDRSSYAATLQAIRG